MKSVVTAVAIVIGLTGCGDKEQSGKTLSIGHQPGLTETEIKTVSEAMGSLVSTCPGIHRYWDDMSVEKLAHVSEGFEPNSRIVSVTLKVSDSPKKIPKSYFSAGHSCEFSTQVAQKPNVFAAKRPCISICLDKETNLSFAEISSETKQPIIETSSIKSSQAPKPTRHFYSIQDGLEYGYEQAVSAEAQRQGQVANKILMFKFLGERDGVLQFHGRDGAFHSVFQCERPCEFVKQMVFYDQRLQKKEHMRAVEGSIVWALTRDGMNGVLKSNVKERDGKLQEYWFDEKGPKWRPVEKSK